MFALAPALVVTATVNWDLFAVGLTAFFLYAWARSGPGRSPASCSGFAIAAKFYPLFLDRAADRAGAAHRADGGPPLITVGTGGGDLGGGERSRVFCSRNEGWAQVLAAQLDPGRRLGHVLVHRRALSRSRPDRAAGSQPFVEPGRRTSRLLNVAHATLLFGLGCLGVAGAGAARAAAGRGWPSSASWWSRCSCSPARCGRSSSCCG